MNGTFDILVDFKTAHGCDVFRAMTQEGLNFCELRLGQHSEGSDVRWMVSWHMVARFVLRAKGEGLSVGSLTGGGAL